MLSGFNTESYIIYKHRVSSPVDCVLPIAKWEEKDYPEDLDEVGPLVEHVYEVQY